MVKIVRVIEIMCDSDTMYFVAGNLFAQSVFINE